MAFGSQTLHVRGRLPSERRDQGTFVVAKDLLLDFVASILLFTAVMYGIQEAFRRVPAWVSLVTFSILPIVLTPYWLVMHQDVGVFPWLKLYTMVVSVSWLTALRGTKLGKHRRGAMGLIGLLVLNIVEALTLDATGGHLSHWLVMLAGALMLITLPSVKGASCRATNGSSGEFLYPGMTRRWVIEYTVWNWTFLFLNFPIIAGQHAAVLGAALIVGMMEPQRWLQARGHTLAASLLLMATFPNFMVHGFDTTLWHTPQREAVASLLCVVVVVAIASTVRWPIGRRTSFGPAMLTDQEELTSKNKAIGTYSSSR